MEETTLLAPARRRLADLMDRAIDTLEALPNDPALSADRRADVALRLLDMVTAGAQGRAPEAAVARPRLLPASCFAIPDFLSPELHAAAAQTALQVQEQFVASSVTTGEPGYRRSRVVFEDALPGLYQPMQQEIMGVLPAVCTALMMPVFEPTRIELHMTVHGDGDYFKLHNDTAAPEIARRAISFVWYDAAPAVRFQRRDAAAVRDAGNRSAAARSGALSGCDAGGQHDGVFRQPPDA